MTQLHIFEEIKVIALLMDSSLNWTKFIHTFKRHKALKYF